jgi:hypothetical protein
MRPGIKFSIRFWTGLAASVVVLTQGVHARAAGSSSQSAQPPPAVALRGPSQPLNLGLMTVVTYLAYFAGQPVRIVNVRVHEVISPRLFTIESSRMPSSHSERYGYDTRALVVLGSPTSAALRRGAIVDVMGEPWSLYEAQVRRDEAALSELRPHDVRRFEHKPVIHADLVRTPGGIELYTGR